MAGILRTDTIQNSNTSTIITQTNSTTITIGTSGQTVALASGASQSGFGRAGSVNWDTTPKTTSPVTAVSGNGYFINTTSGAITVTLPATPTAGDIVAIADYANTSATNNIIIGRNGSNIDGSAVDAKIKVNGQVYTLVYVDSTEGWKTVGQTFNQIDTAEFVAATGGTITTCGNYKIHTFTGPGTFTVTNAGNPAGSATVDYLVVAGGGNGGGDYGGGGGAGGFRESVPSPAAWTASPLANPGGALPVSATGYPITIGAGGTGSGEDIAGNPGSPSTFSSITSTGGGRGGTEAPVGSAGPGGSGGGEMRAGAGIGTGNTPPVSPPQGNNGGTGAPGAPGYTAGGGGGAGAAGSPTPSNSIAGAGGAGVTTSISGSPVTIAGGGGGAGGGSPFGQGYTPGAGGPGGGGAGAVDSPTGVGTPGTVNTGSGGGGANLSGPSVGGNGGSGIVVIRYKYQ